jgi:hypothetical protein
MLRVPHTSSPGRENCTFTAQTRLPNEIHCKFPDTYLSHEIYILTENIVPTVKYSRDIIRTLASLQCEQYLNCKFPLDTRKISFRQEQVT